MVKKIIITGASGGIGSATARLLAEPETYLILHATRITESLECLADELRTYGAFVALCCADFRREAEVVRFWKDLLPIFSDIPFTGLVNTAGFDLMTSEAKLLSFSQRLEQILAVDVRAAVLLSRKIADQFQVEALDFPSRSRTIVLMGWGGVDRGMEGETAQLYAIAKGGIIAFMKSLAQEIAPVGRVCSVSPGWIQTRWGQKASNQAQERAVQESLMERWGRPEEVAALIRFLLSEEALFINGQNIVIDGGFNYRNMNKGT